MAGPAGSRLAYISRNVVDLERSVAFYCKRLGFVAIGPGYAADPFLLDCMGLAGHRLNARRLRYGREEIELVEVGAHGRPYPERAAADDLLFQHFALRCANIEAACSRLLRPEIDAAIPGIITRTASDMAGANPIASAIAVTLPVSSGGVAAFKFRDPDGHPLELIQFPASAGSTSNPCEGIDHSAISVSDLDRSIDFYAAMLGLSVGARQLNQGKEQCLLDGLDKAIVDVVALFPSDANSMHLELLRYRMDAINPARAASSLPRAPADIASDRLVFETNSAKPAAPQAGGWRFITDPDGHFLMIAGST